ncbi:hypothetical protein [Candidatus Albibeggiatoa sp. nov. NOAA]|uniref:hypothetical protein n=1 Tax=Candidatus Albibeggiatoa sp. nov. NOAA TaxID=3162724 RepID=UPI0033005386|nr:hypothetical protein [Thiotrichaceae bacterium]
MQIENTELKLQRSEDDIKNSKSRSNMTQVLLAVYVAMSMVKFFPFAQSNTFSGLEELVFEGLAILLIVLTIIQAKYKTLQLHTESLILDTQGMRYHSALPTWIQSKYLFNKNWSISWEQVKAIDILPNSDYKWIRFAVHTQNQTHEVPIVHWVDSQTLDDRHTQSPFKSRRDSQSHYGLTDEELHNVITATPLYQYFIQNQVSINPPPVNFCKREYFKIQMILLIAFVVITALVIIFIK